MDACMKATGLVLGGAGLFPGGGFSLGFNTKAESPVTMVRVNLVAGLAPVLQIAEGYTVELPEDACPH